MAAQLEQLLTCCICLDRYRNPKLLPCQHSVCMEPCMEGLVDYVRRQVKCPECRAEHRIPYNGVTGFPANVTLQRFLEAHIEITGETPDPFTGQIMERCGVCNEKNYLSTCAHCEKKICVDCKAAHTDILKREIGRINNQVKRAVHRLNDQLSTVERNIHALKQNTDSVNDEVENITQRLQKSVKDRGEFIRNEVLKYYKTELHNLTSLKEGLEQELSNVDSNTELADKHMSDQTNWDDCELMDAKDIFLRTMEFIRNFDYEAGDYNRRARFNVPDDVNKLASTLSTLGELIINTPKQAMNGFHSGASTMQSGLAKSKSDHRLASQFREDDSHGYSIGRTSPICRRKFGERIQPTEESTTHESTGDIGRRRFRSRFMRREEEDERSSRSNEDENQSKSRPRVIDTEDVSRGPLSGITRMIDSPRVIQRLQEKEGNFKKKKVEIPKSPQIQPTPKPLTFGTPRKTARQMSEDEIEKIKKQNKSEPSTSASATAITSATATGISSTTTPKPSLDRLNSIKDSERSNKSERGTNANRSTHSPSSPTVQEEETNRRTSRDYGSGSTTSIASPTRKTSYETGTTNKTFSFSRSSSTSSVGESGKPSTGTKNGIRAASRSNSTDSNASIEGVGRSANATINSEDTKNKLKKTSNTESKSSPNTRSYGGTSRYQPRHIGRAGTPSADASKNSENEDEDEEEDDEDESTEESDSEESEEESSEEDHGINSSHPRSGRGSQGSRMTNGRSTSGAVSGNDSGYGSGISNTKQKKSNSSHDTSTYNKSSGYDATKSIRESNEEMETKYPYASMLLNRSRANNEDDKSYQSRYLNKSKSSAILKPDVANDEVSHTSGTGSSRAKFEELKERRQRLARSKSSAGMDEDETPNDSTSSYRSRYGNESNSYNNGTRTTNTSKGSDDDNSSSQLSSWARYLKNKYGNKTANNSQATSNVNGANGASAANKSSSAVSRSKSSHLLGLAKENETTNDNSKNVLATPTSQAVGTLVPTPFGNLHRSQYSEKQKLLFKIGSRGSEPEHFTWPRGIAVGPDDSIVVADSSNHRVQVFDKKGKYIKSFGSYGNGEGEFDCLAGVAVNRIGQFIIADRYNHRIQIFDCSGMFIRSFGSQGSGDGKFSYPWGVTADNLGFIYICDKENHRIQVFESDGTFVGKFGSLGNKEGQLEHPHYIAVSTSNQVIVSDSNNHRIQVFDVNGKVIRTFGSEGSDDGQFKFPRGVAVDSRGQIYVADSGNNRIQIFTSDGTFIRGFGCWGSGPGEFKGLEGLSVMSNGKILVCDRENHRIQVF